MRSLLGYPQLIHSLSTGYPQGKWVLSTGCPQLVARLPEGVPNKCGKTKTLVPYAALRCARSPAVMTSFPTRTTQGGLPLCRARLRVRVVERVVARASVPVVVGVCVPQVCTASDRWASFSLDESCCQLFLSRQKIFRSELSVIQMCTALDR